MAYTPQTWVNGPGGATPISATRLGVIETGLQEASSIGELIDAGGRATVFDIQAVGTTLTEVDGCRIIVPARTRPFELKCSLPVQFVSGATPVAGTFHTVLAQVWNETLADSKAYGYGSESYVQVTAASRVVNRTISISQIMEPNATQYVFKLMMSLSAAAVSGWTSTVLRAGNVPQSGEVYPPVWLTAVGL